MDNTSKPIQTHKMPWMPLTEGLWVRPLRLVGEERTLQLRVDPGVTIPPHRHTGFVHALNLSGHRQLSNGHIAGPGDYVYEPPSNLDTWSCIGDEPCVIQITMSGRVENIDEDGNLLSYTDTAKLREKYLEWCKRESYVPVAIGASD
ncbi:cupin domain-containing protein [Shewanella salipaludis]|uniref:Anti-sigma factor n=1 Tax=Shewanella salipaludis TaxID=2723052 RepID=A0A972JNU1_9GAMM|nr:cupin domain-containing protein [Shewanella salipaludis]NMH66501.1 anti-sigma factor [Shewanella salipaludis]